jgi:hypothetical protein
VSATCREHDDVEEYLIDGQEQRAPEGNAVVFAFEVESYTIVNAWMLTSRQVLRNVRGISAPLQGCLSLQSVSAGQVNAAPALMAILGPSGAGATLPMLSCFCSIWL